MPSTTLYQRGVPVKSKLRPSTLLRRKLAQTCGQKLRVESVVQQQPQEMQTAGVCWHAYTGGMHNCAPAHSHTTTSG